MSCRQSALGAVALAFAMPAQTESGGRSFVYDLRFDVQGRVPVESRGVPYKIVDPDYLGENWEIRFGDKFIASKRVYSQLTMRFFVTPVGWP